jgi:hypothetical protein
MSKNPRGAAAPIPVHRVPHAAAVAPIPPVHEMPPGGVPSMPMMMMASPPSEIIVADGVMSLRIIGALARFYFYTADPDPRGGDTTSNTVREQVVMLIDGFIAAFAIFEATVNKMLAAGVLKPEQIVAARATLK